MKVLVLTIAFKSQFEYVEAWVITSRYHGFIRKMAFLWCFDGKATPGTCHMILQKSF